MIRKIKEIIEEIEIGDLSIQELYYYVKIIKELDLIYVQIAEELEEEDYME